MSSNVVVCVLGAHERLSAGDLKLRVTKELKLKSLEVNSIFGEQSSTALRIVLKFFYI